MPKESSVGETLLACGILAAGKGWEMLRPDTQPAPVPVDVPRKRADLRVRGMLKYIAIGGLAAAANIGFYEGLNQVADNIWDEDEIGQDFPTDGDFRVVETCDTEPLPPSIQEATDETIAYWETGGIDLSGVEVLFVPDPTENGCLVPGDPKHEPTHGPRYIGAIDTVVIVEIPEIKNPAIEKYVITHEYGHAIQQRDPWTRYFSDLTRELQADCSTGIVVGATDTAADIESAQATALEIGNPSLHGSGEMRAAAIGHGANTGNCEVQSLISALGPLSDQRPLVPTG